MNFEMGYYCSECREYILKKIYEYSIEHHNKPLCIECQKDYDREEWNTWNPRDKISKKVLYNGNKKKSKITPEAIKLFKALKSRGVPAELEKFDGFKHIDIAIVEAKVNIEVDGMQHNFNHNQALQDLKRTFHSFKKGYVTLRVPNRLIQQKLEE